MKVMGFRKKTKKTKIKYALCGIAIVLAFLCGCSSQNISDENVAKEDEVLTERTYSADSEYVKNIGRTYAENGILWLAHSASGIEFTFRGTSASVTIVGDAASTKGKDGRARFAVYINGERLIDEQINRLLNTYQIFHSEETADVTVKILKLSESANSTMGIRDINVVSVADIAPTEQKDLKIEFVGDSITCGYGVDDEVKEHHFSTSTEDATKAYAYKTAQLLDADYSLVSYSGHGIVSGYTGEGKLNAESLVPDYYEQFARTYGSSKGYYNEAAEWDFNKFVPDYVVINLGTNDYSYTKNDAERITEYKNAYVEFLKVVRKNNPNAHIICSLGLMGDELYSTMEESARDYMAETGDENVSVFHFTPHDGSTGYAADWHPTEKTHDKAAEELTNYMKSLRTE